MSQFFKFPQHRRYGRQVFSVASGNVRTSAPEINDNDYTTFSTEQTFILETYGDTRTTNTLADHIFIIGENLTNYSVSVPTGMGSGAGVSNATIPADNVIAGRQYGFSRSPVNAREVQVTVTGTDTRVYEIMLLDLDVATDSSYTSVNPQKFDRGAQTRTNIRGNTIRTSGPSRPKWQTDFTGLFFGSTAGTADTLIRFFDDNPNFVFSENLTRFPDRCYMATLVGGVSISYRGRQYNQRDLSFTILES